jgi:hypothetical protein
MEEQIKIILVKQKLKQFMTTKLELQKIFKEVLHTEKQDNCSHENIGKNKSNQISR